MKRLLMAAAVGIVPVAGVVAPAQAAFPWVDMTPTSADCVWVGGVQQVQARVLIKNIGHATNTSTYVYFFVPDVMQAERRQTTMQPLAAGQSVNFPIYFQEDWPQLTPGGQHTLKIRLYSNNEDMNRGNDNGTFTITCPAGPR